MTRRAKHHLLALAVAVLAAGCAGQPSAGPVAIALEQRLTASPLPAAIDLGEIVAEPWDAVIVFGPYTSPATIEAFLGSIPSSDISDRLAKSDSDNLFVFTSKGRVVSQELIPRGIADFPDGALPLMLSRDSAIFDVTFNEHPTLTTHTP